MTLPTAGCLVLRRTERALLVRVADREVWLPASQVRWTAEGLWLPAWLAQAKGLAAKTVAPSYRPTARQRFARECGDMARREVEWAGGNARQADTAAAAARYLESV